MTFLEKYEILNKSIPVSAVSNGLETVDCEFADYTYGSKNCYYCFNGYRLFDSAYTDTCWGTKIFDCTYVAESEKCYQCSDCNKCFNCTYLTECLSSSDCHFSSFLTSCTDCFGCVGLTHKKYCIFNKQYSKEEYFKKLEELKKQPAEKILEQMVAIKKQIPHPASQQFNSLNSPYGDYIYSTKNSFWCFDSHYMENSGYIYVSGFSKKCWDMYKSGADENPQTSSQGCYQMVDSGNCYNCAFMFSSSGSTNCCYSSSLSNCSDCWGCVGLTNKKYCILNNQLSKEQYFNALKQIKKELGWKM